MVLFVFTCAAIGCEGAQAMGDPWYRRVGAIDLQIHVAVSIFLFATRSYLAPTYWEALLFIPFFFWLKRTAEKLIAAEGTRKGVAAVSTAALNSPPRQAFPLCPVDVAVLQGLYTKEVTSKTFVSFVNVDVGEGLTTCPRVPM